MTTTTATSPLAMTSLPASRPDLCRAFARMFQPLPRTAPGDVGAISDGWDEAMWEIAAATQLAQAENAAGAMNDPARFDLWRRERQEALAVQQAQAAAA